MNKEKLDYLKKVVKKAKENIINNHIHIYEWNQKYETNPFLYNRDYCVPKGMEKVIVYRGKCKICGKTIETLQRPKTILDRIADKKEEQAQLLRKISQRRDRW